MLLLAILEASRMRIDWKETEKRIRKAGFTNEQIKKFKEKLIEMYIRFLDEGKEVPIIFRGLHSSIVMKSKTKPYRRLFPIVLKRRKVVTTRR